MKTFGDELRNAPQEAERKRKAEEEARREEWTRKYNEENCRIAENVVSYFREGCRKEASEGKHSIDFMPNGRRPHVGLLLYDSPSTMFLSKEWKYKRAQIEIIPLIEKELSTMGLRSYSVTLREFSDADKLFKRYLGFRIKASW